MRNRDWGAVAYLAHSNYGRDGTQIAINSNGDMITGYAGVFSSTKGNETGIFDMRGGVTEVVAAFVDNGHENLTHIHAARFTSNENRKFVDVYRQGTESTIQQERRGNNYIANQHIFGNAMWETSFSGLNANNAWFGNNTNFPESFSPFFSRGGTAFMAGMAGVFSFGPFNGAPHSNFGFRTILIP